MKNLLTCAIVLFLLALCSVSSHAAVNPHKDALLKKLGASRDNIHPVLINGKIVEPGTGWDHVVSIRTGNAGCTATIVGPQAIITAAHCAGNGATSVFTYKGKQYSAKMTRSPIYPGKDHDICIGKLSEAVPEGTDLAVIGGVVEKGSKLTLLGYGCTQNGGGGADGKLRIGDATVVNFSGYDAVSTDGAALCFGDSGGPGFLQTQAVHIPQDGAFHPMPSLYRLATINSKGNIKDTNYTARLDLPESQTFLKDWATKENVQVCGINADCGTGPQPQQFTMKNAAGELLFKLNAGIDLEFVKGAATYFMKYVGGEQ